MPMRNQIGVMASLRGDGSSLKYVADFGLKTCQLCCWDKNLFTDKLAESIRRESRKTKVKITSLWAGWPGPAVWDLVDGPYTLGLVPPQYRAERVAVLKAAGDWAGKAGIPAIVTHLGFIPENAKDPEFAAVVAAVNDIAEHCKKLGVEFWFETGQETPVTMLRLIQQVGTGNLGVNLDPANLILYGKANPVDSLDVFGQHVTGIHAKDGLYPTDPMKLGHEVKVGEGKVRFPDFVRRLGEIGYTGAFIIEREIGGDQQTEDIATTVKYLKNLLAR